jgi:hypothetical protein
MAGLRVEDYLFHEYLDRISANTFCAAIPSTTPLRYHAEINVFNRGINGIRQQQGEFLRGL